MFTTTSRAAGTAGDGLDSDTVPGRNRVVARPAVIGRIAALRPAGVAVAPELTVVVPAFNERPIFQFSSGLADLAFWLQQPGNLTAALPHYSAAERSGGLLAPAPDAVLSV